MLRRPPGHEPYTRKEVLCLRCLAPHLQRALQIHLRLACSKAQRHNLEILLDSLMTATVLLDMSGQLIYINAIAERILTRGDGFGIRNGYLVAAHRGSQATLSQAVGAAQTLYSNSQTHPPAIIALRRPSGRQPYTVFVIPYPHPSEPIRWADPQSRSAVVLFFSDPEAAVSPFYPGVLQSLYGLSPQEAYLAALLTGGRTLQEAANTLHVSPNTVKTQLKAVFAKTHIHCQTELVRLGAIHNIPACPPPRQPREKWKADSP